MAKKETNTKLEVAICDIKDIDSINIESLIRVIRGQQVMLDSDLAMLYGVETKALNQAVKRNINRFFFLSMRSPPFLNLYGNVISCSAIGSAVNSVSAP